MKLSVASFFAERFNLNGDQANLEVLQRRASAYGHELAVVSSGQGDAIETADLVFIGHGSIAAWRSVEPEFEAYVRELGSNNLVLAIGSGAERVAAEQGTVIKRGSRESVFARHSIETPSGTLEVVGYLNSDTKSITTQWAGRTILSMLHGPVLAKNPEFADAILSEMLAARGGELGEKASELVRLDELSAAARRDASR